MSDGFDGAKRMLVEMLDALACAGADGMATALAAFCHADCVWDIFHPVNRCVGNAEACDRFWRPLTHALPDWDYRPGILIGGSYEGAAHANGLGFVMGTLTGSLFNIPADHQLVFLRFGIDGRIRDGKFAHVHILFDLVDLMRQVGHYPLRAMPGSAEQWPFPPAERGLSGTAADAEQGRRSLGIVLDMQYGLPEAGAVTDIASATAAHSPHWHEAMNWYGPAGIGSSRGLRGFRDYHGALFLKAFPDRGGVERDPGQGVDAAGDYVRLGDGRFAVTGGWPAMRGTHSGGQWLGLPPTGVELTMRVADWYRLDRDNRIVDNWVMIDLPHMLDQMGLDILDDVRFFADPTLSRL